MIHQEYNLEPVNWQAPNTKNVLKVVNDSIELIGVHNKPYEELIVRFEEFYTVSYYSCEDICDLEIRGYEKHMVDLAYEKPDLIEHGFRPTKREYQTDNGFIDLMGVDKEDHLMILEFKSRQAGMSAVKQLKRYVDCFLDNKDFVRGIIVAPAITVDALEELESLQMEFKSMEPPKEFLKSNKPSTLDAFF